MTNLKKKGKVYGLDKNSNRALVFILFIDPEKRIFWSFRESELKILAPYSSIECWYLVEGKIAESLFVDLVLAMVCLILIFIVFVSGLLCWTDLAIYLVFYDID